MTRKEILEKLSRNPHYRLSAQQEAELYTQDIKSTDNNVTVPKTRKSKRVTTQEVKPEQISKDNSYELNREVENDLSDII